MRRMRFDGNGNKSLVQIQHGKETAQLHNCRRLKIIFITVTFSMLGLILSNKTIYSKNNIYMSPMTHLFGPIMILNF